ncbi:hypothetical protein [Nonomuraea sp. NPDC050786]|uniref:hypothetical protein n=1 Tax=Nonomuraea sp. NPDC050786 TaxID=3154840 RepID=UPI0033FE1DA8
MTATAENLTQVQIYRGSETVVISLDSTEYGFEVSATSFYRTSHGARVGGSFERFFSKLEDARKYANGYYAHMIKKGYARVQPRKR